MNILDTYGWSSRLTRSLQSRPCPLGESAPCHVYLTAAREMSTAVFVNVHMAADWQGGLTVVVNTDRRFTMSETAVPMLDDHDQRRVFAAYVSGLKPNTTVPLSIVSSNNSTLYSLTMCTAPARPPVRFVVGGDTGSSENVIGVNKHVGRSNPSFVVNGGDVAYDNGLFACASAWDRCGGAQWC